MTNDNISLKASISLLFELSTCISLHEIPFQWVNSQLKQPISSLFSFSSSRASAKTGEDWLASPRSPPAFLRSGIRTVFSSAVHRDHSFFLLPSLRITHHSSPFFGKPSLPPSSALFRPTSLLLTRARWYGTRLQSSSWSRRVFSSPVLS